MSLGVLVFLVGSALTSVPQVSHWRAQLRQQFLSPQLWWVETCRCAFAHRQLRDQQEVK